MVLARYVVLMLIGHDVRLLENGDSFIAYFYPSDLYHGARGHQR